MSNDRLRDALLSVGMSPEELATAIKVDPKTVVRWIDTGRSPYPKHRYRAAAALKQSEQYLWPNAVTPNKADKASQSEVVNFYPHRSAVSPDLWDQLLDRAVDQIDMLVYVGMFMTEKPKLLNSLKAKAEDGAKIRLLFGDRDSDAVIQRSLDEGIGRDTISAKVDHAVAHFRPLAPVSGVEVRTHRTVLYNSIYRFDDEMIVNPHVWGKIASHAPALHLRRLSAGSLFQTYAESFDAVWNESNSREIW